MSEQLTFDLPTRTGVGRDDFFVSDANKAAVAGVDGWQDWPQRRMILAGPEGAGKTHLAHIWADTAGADVVNVRQFADYDLADWTLRPVCLEDLDALADNLEAQKWVFHVYNLSDQAGVPVLLTGRGLTQDWADMLPDLASRLASVNRVELGAPDDALMAAVLVKLFEDRQLAPDATVIKYLLPRIERSFAAAQDVVQRLDSEALKRSRPISVPLARSVLNTPDAPGTR